MRKILFGIGLCALTIPLDFGCSTKDDNGSSSTADNKGKTDIDLGLGGMDSVGPKIPACTSFIGLTACEEKGESAEKLNVNLLLVIDKSGSMDDKGGFPDSKWETMKLALEGSLTEVQNELNVGLALYPFSDDPTVGISKAGCGLAGNCCEMPSGSDPNILIGPGTETVPQIVKSFVNIRPGGGTPTSTALAHAYDYFVTGAGKDLEGPKYVVLATDGGPNCNSDITCQAASCTANIESREDCSVDGENCCTGTAGAQICLDDGATKASVGRLRDAGVDTFVIGVPGSEFYGDLLDELAVAGGRPVKDEAKKFFEVDAAAGVDSLTNIFRKITQELVTSCDIQLDEKPGSFQQVNVAVDCEIIPQTAEAGTNAGGAGGAGASGKNWIVDMDTSPATIRLQGDLCKRVKTGVKRVDVVLGCPPVL